MVTNDTNESNKKEKIVYKELSYKVMGAIFEVHKRLGPGFLETVYEKALVDELVNIGLNVESQKQISIFYKGKKIGIHKLDLVVESKIVIELKTVQQFCSYHRNQVISYLKAGGYKLGILVNFSKSKVDCFRVVLN
ncbi:MAG: GxxExxY protein [Elusimicrobia bacterium]|nr:GxxExxY protein [Elusimicrobiota bacterium]